MSEKEDDIEVETQQAEADVQHRNLEAAGDDHPLGDEPLGFNADLKVLIRRVADDLYESWEETIREYLANAETACLRVERYLETGESKMFDGDLIVGENYQPKIEVTWNRQENKLSIKDNGIGMSAEVVDQVFRQIGRTTSRDDGEFSGNFGQGVLSFVKFTGLDNAMLMTSHSRINDTNAAYYVTLAGIEPIRGQLADDEYGTKFQMTPDENYNVRQAVEKYAEWMRVPVIYREINEQGQEVFNEDWGDKALHEAYDDHRVCLRLNEEGAFDAYCSPEASSKTLLLSMQIDRNDSSGRHRSPGQHDAPFPFDVRLLDESGKVIECGCPNAEHENLMPCPRSDYESMLLQAREPHITEDLLNNGDVVGQMVESGPNEGKMVVADDVLDSGKPLPSKHDYVAKGDLSTEDEPGETLVIFGPNEGRKVVSEEEWNEKSEGRAALYVPEDELSSYDLDTGRGDLTLPKPTSDRGRLQSHNTFWEYIGQQFGEKFDKTVLELYDEVQEADDALEAIMNLEEEDLRLALRGIAEIPSGRLHRADNTANAINKVYNSSLNEETANLLNRLRKSNNAARLMEAYDNLGLKNANLSNKLSSIPDDKISDGGPSRVDALNVLDKNLTYSLAPRGNPDSATKKRSRDSVYVPRIVNDTHPNGTVYMAKSTSGAFPKKATIAWELHDDNEVMVVDEYEKWEDLLGWKKLKDFPHGKNQIREEYGDVLDDDVLDEIAPKSKDNDDDSSSSSKSSSNRGSSKPVKKKVLNIAIGSRHRKRSKYSAEAIKEAMSDPDKSLFRNVEYLVLFPSDTDRNMTDNWWVAGWVDRHESNCAIATCTKGVYEYLEDVDGVWHIDDYIEQAKEYEIMTTEGMKTLPEVGEDLVLHFVSDETRERLMQETVFHSMSGVIPDYYNESNYSTVEFPDEEDFVYAPVLQEDMFWLRPILTPVTDIDVNPIVMKGNIAVRSIGKVRSMSSDYKLYARARLPNWDFDWKELDVLDKHSYRVDFNEGGYEFIETLGMLHDMGEKPFSQTPKTRWENDAQ